MIRTQLPTDDVKAAEQIPSQVQPGRTAEILWWPVLAQNVQLLGEIQGTGFTDRQWLIQRGDRFVQVTELLYHIAGQANGEHTFEQIAAEVTKSTDWMVSADDVRQLTQTKLVPLGLITTADGSIMSRGEDQARSPLQVTMRLKVASGRIIRHYPKQ